MDKNPANCSAVGSAILLDDVIELLKGYEMEINDSLPKQLAFM